MKRISKLWRYISNKLTVLSLLLMLATVGLWVDSYWYTLGIIRNAPGRGICPLALQLRGTVEVGIYTNASINENGWLMGRKAISDYNGYVNLYTEDTESQWLGFAYNWESSSYKSEYIVAIPHWFLTLIFAILPAIWFIKWCKKRKLAVVGKCPSCGYDLTGNTTGECPECGETATENNSN